MSCDCYKIGGPFIAEDPDCPEHGWEAQKERERHEIKLEGLNQRIRFLEAERDALRAAVKEARKAALEDALIACNDEALEDPTGSADDIAYDLAVEDCCNAIRAIAAKEPK